MQATAMQIFILMSGSCPEGILSRQIGLMGIFLQLEFCYAVHPRRILQANPVSGPLFYCMRENFHPLTIILTGVATYLVFYSIFPAGIWDKPLGAMTLIEIFGALGVLVAMLGLIGLCVVSLFQLPVEAEHGSVRDCAQIIGSGD